MKVIVAKNAGFCRGVKRAVDKARQTARNAVPPVHTDGPLIHNEQVMQQLRSDGIVETNEPEALRNGTLIIRAHGIPPERRDRLRQLPVRLVDATCPDVARIQGSIRRYAAKGYDIIIFGDPGHVEVVGLLGYANGRGFVVATPADIACLPHMERVCLCSQSTQFPSDYDTIAAAVRQRYPDSVVLDTICDSTRNRQSEVLQLASEADVIVVVGSTHSANTLRLVELARRLKPTFHIQTRAQIRPEDFRGFRIAGLTAGASTPDFVIGEVREALETL